MAFYLILAEPITAGNDLNTLTLNLGSIEVRVKPFDKI
jgi:hypothetical protein